MRTNKRRNLTSSQWAAIAVEADELIEVLKKEAKERQIRKPESVMELIPQQNDTTRDKVASIFNTNSRYVQDAMKLKESNPEAFEQIKSGEKTITEVKKEIKIEERRINIEKIKEEIKQTSETEYPTKYNVIVVDPPWNYGREYDPESSRVANPYPEMSQDELLKLDIPADKDCVLWLWTTHAFIWDAKELLTHWGFEYKATLVWDKEKIGMGHWLRMQCEFCLLGIKGLPVLDENTTIRDIIREPRREHSRKPEAFYKLVDAFSVGLKCELFSRQERKGYFVHGAETKLFTNGLA